MKKIITSFVRSLDPKFTKHYLWPTFTHSRNFDFKRYYKKNKKRVNFGAGPYFVQHDWISIDLGSKNIPSKNIFFKNFTHKSLDLSNFKSFTLRDIEVAYASHFLEHLNEMQLVNFLKNVRKCFKKGAVFRIVIPDADLIIDRLKNDDLDYFLPFQPALKKYNFKFTKMNIFYFFLNIKALFGDEIKIINEEMLNDYNADKLITLLNKLSYKRTNNIDGSFHLIALNYKYLRKLLLNAGFKKVNRSAFMQSKVGEMRETPTFDGTHPWLSLYIEAIA